MVADELFDRFDLAPGADPQGKAEGALDVTIGVAQGRRQQVDAAGGIVGRFHGQPADGRQGRAAHPLVLVLHPGPQPLEPAGRLLAQDGLQGLHSQLVAILPKDARSRQVTDEGHNLFRLSQLHRPQGHGGHDPALAAVLVPQETDEGQVGVHVAAGALADLFADGPQDGHRGAHRRVVEVADAPISISLLLWRGRRPDPYVLQEIGHGGGHGGAVGFEPVGCRLCCLFWIHRFSFRPVCPRPSSGPRVYGRDQGLRFSGRRARATRTGGISLKRPLQLRGWRPGSWSGGKARSSRPSRTKPASRTAPSRTCSGR